jgi:hypothetical protein
MAIEIMDSEIMAKKILIRDIFVKEFLFRKSMVEDEIEEVPVLTSNDHY